MCAFRIKKELAIKLRQHKNQTKLLETLLEDYFCKNKKETKRSRKEGLLSVSDGEFPVN